MNRFHPQEICASPFPTILETQKGLDEVKADDLDIIREGVVDAYTSPLYVFKDPLLQEDSVDNAQGHLEEAKNADKTQQYLTLSFEDATIKTLPSILTEWFVLELESMHQYTKPFFAHVPTPQKVSFPIPTHESYLVVKLFADFQGDTRHLLDSVSISKEKAKATSKNESDQFKQFLGFSFAVLTERTRVSDFSTIRIPPNQDICSLQSIAKDIQSEKSTFQQWIPLKAFLPVEFSLFEPSEKTLLKHTFVEIYKKEKYFSTIRNHITVSPLGVKLGKSVEYVSVETCVMADDDDLMADGLSIIKDPGTFNGFIRSSVSPVGHKSTTHKFDHSLEFDLPLRLSSGIHLLFKLWSVTPQNSTLIGYSILPLYHDERIVDEYYELPVFKHLPASQYLISILRFSKDTVLDPFQFKFSVKIEVQSSIYPQDPFINRWMLQSKSLLAKRQMQKHSKSRHSGFDSNTAKELMLLKMLRTCYRSGLVMSRVEGAKSNWKQKWIVLSGDKVSLYSSVFTISQEREIQLTDPSASIQLMNDSEMGKVIALKSTDTLYIASSDDKFVQSWMFQFQHIRSRVLGGIPDALPEHLLQFVHVIQRTFLKMITMKDRKMLKGDMTDFAIDGKAETLRLSAFRDLIGVLVKLRAVAGEEELKQILKDFFPGTFLWDVETPFDTEYLYIHEALLSLWLFVLEEGQNELDGCQSDTLTVSSILLQWISLSLTVSAHSSDGISPSTIELVESVLLAILKESVRLSPNGEDMSVLTTVASFCTSLFHILHHEIVYELVCSVVSHMSSSECILRFLFTLLENKFTFKLCETSAAVISSKISSFKLVSEDPLLLSALQQSSDLHFHLLPTLFVSQTLKHFKSNQKSTKTLLPVIANAFKYSFNASLVFQSLPSSLIRLSSLDHLESSDCTEHSDIFIAFVLLVSHDPNFCFISTENLPQSITAFITVLTKAVHSYSTVDSVRTSYSNTITTILNLFKSIIVPIIEEIDSKAPWTAFSKFLVSLCQCDLSPQEEETTIEILLSLLHSNCECINRGFDALQCKLLWLSVFHRVSTGNASKAIISAWTQSFALVFQSIGCVSKYKTAVTDAFFGVYELSQSPMLLDAVNAFSQFFKNSNDGFGSEKALSVEAMGLARNLGEAVALSVQLTFDDEGDTEHRADTYLSLIRIFSECKLYKRQIQLLEQLVDFHLKHHYLIEAAHCQEELFRLVLKRGGNDGAVKASLRKASKLYEIADLVEKSIEMDTLALKSALQSNAWETSLSLRQNIRSLVKRMGGFYLNKQFRGFGCYYRVLFMGSKFKELNSREFIYKELNLVRLAEITQRLVDLFSKKLNTTVKAVMGDLKQTEECCIQITSVSPYFEGLEPPTDYERFYGQNLFTFSTPFTKEGNARGGMGEQFKRVTVLQTEHSFPSLSHRLLVVKRSEVVLSPIENAIEDIRSRNRVLIAEISPPSGFPSLKSLSQFLSGSVCVQVNSGVGEVCHVFLGKTKKEYPENNVLTLQNELRTFFQLVKDALPIARDLCESVDQFTLQKEFEDGFQRQWTFCQSFLSTSFSQNK